jgi:hypothetical protein|tara:strand:- start:3228 stop:3854 length:627 start_codon:yes stop_codon:yes gene_type:complete
MKTTDEKKAFLKGLEDLTKKRSNERQKSYLDQKVAPDKSVNLAKGSLDKDVMTAKSSASADVTPERVNVEKMDKIDTVGQKQPLISGDDFVKKQQMLEKQRLMTKFKKAAESGDHQMMELLKDKARKFAKVASKGLKTVPVLGSLAALATAEDAAAAVPILDSAESVGMSAEDENRFLAETQGRMDYQDSPARQDRLDALAKLLKSKQ